MRALAEVRKTKVLYCSNDVKKLEIWMAAFNTTVDTQSTHRRYNYHVLQVSQLHRRHAQSHRRIQAPKLYDVDIHFHAIMMTFTAVRLNRQMRSNVAVNVSMQDRVS